MSAMSSLLRRVWLRLLREWWSYTVPARLRNLGVKIDGRCVFLGMPIVSMAPGSEIRLAKGVVLVSDSRFTALGVSYPTVLRTLRSGAKIEIGADTGISGGSVCAALSIRIGRECLIGADVIIADTDFHAIEPLNRRYNNSDSDITANHVVVEDNVFVGTRALILKGVTVGANSVVGAGAVVSRSLRGDVIAVGSAAREIRTLKSSGARSAPC